VTITDTDPSTQVAPAEATPALLPSAQFHELGALLAATGGDNIDLAAEAAKDWARVWVIREPHTATLLAFVLTWWTQGEVEVAHLGTLPEARRRGLARLLMTRVIETSRTNPGSHAWLEVRRSNNAALALYRELGFVVSRERKKYYSDGEDALEMVLELAPP
jgi:[ribosomal protein S18]-alanine N-acetyltransferase